MFFCIEKSWIIKINKKLSAIAKSLYMWCRNSYFFFLLKNPVTKRIPMIINNMLMNNRRPFLKRMESPRMIAMTPKTMKIFSSVFDLSRRVPILLPMTLLSSLNTLASFSKFFAKFFACASTPELFLTGAFLTGFFVGITQICKGIKGWLEYR